ncbi:uncharacterized protein DC041_0010596, partial [Schistosoma bovis]
MIDITSKIVKQFNGNNHKQNSMITIRSAKAEVFICIDDYIKQFIHNQYMITDTNSDKIIHDNNENNIDDNNHTDELYELLTPKGDVFTVARLAGIQAAKQTSNIIPLCHQQSVSLPVLEMEALTAVSVAALTVYDMLKPLQKGPIIIEKIELLEKLGGSKGSYLKL